MDLARPHTAVAPTLDGEILVVLAGTTRPLTGRQIARLARAGSQAGLNRSLQRLVRHGLVLAQEAGSALLYQLNRSHLAAGAVEVLASMRAELRSRLKAAIGGWKVKPVHASLYGSAARGDGDLASDIDLFVVRPRAVPEEEAAWRDQLHRLQRDVTLWTGNRASVAELPEPALRRWRTSRPAIAASLERDGWVLFGPPVKALLGRKK